MKVFVQKDNGEFIDESAFSVFYGFRALGFPVVSFENSAPKGRQKRDLVYGRIGVVHDALKILNVEIPHNPVIPMELGRYLGRITYVSTIGKFKRTYTEGAIFLKPQSENKLFHGLIIHSKEDLHVIDSLGDDRAIFISEVVDFVSEYRCFVLKGQLVGCKHYKGDFTCTPDFRLMEEAIKSIKDPMVAYSIDFGVTRSYQTLLIEINDTYSLRSYGLPSKLFCEMLRQRWNEIVKNTHTI